MQKKKIKSFEEIKNRKVHFTGIGGIGISSLSRWFLAQKWAISGSDIAKSSITQDLKKDGIKAKMGHKRSNLGSKTGLLVYNQAISSSNPEILEAKRRGIPALSYPEALGILTRAYTTIAVSGAHGKSTTTSILSLILKDAGFDPTVVVGTKIPQFGNSNFRNGKSPYLLIEADEFHESFLNYSPTFGIITNMDREHLDWYKNFSNVKKAFQNYVKNFKEGGILVLNRDDKNVYALRENFKKICAKKDIKIVWYSLKGKDTAKVKRAFSHIPGDHNLSNALGAFILARELGIFPASILKSLKTYKGVWRRMEYKGKKKIGKVLCEIYDDYGHHPTEIKKTLEGAKKFFKNKNIVCVFQPHQTKRLKLLFKDFISAFQSADAAVFVPIYKVAGRDKIEKKYTSESLSHAVSLFSPSLFLVRYAKNPKNIRKEIENILSGLPEKDTVIIMMGAGDIVEYTKLLMK